MKGAGMLGGISSEIHRTCEQGRRKAAVGVLSQHWGRLGSFVCREGGNCGGLQLAYLFPWTTHLACFQPMPAGVGKWDSGVSWMEGGWERTSL